MPGRPDRCHASRRDPARRDRSPTTSCRRSPGRRPGIIQRAGSTIPSSSRIPSERELARIFDFYRVPWRYEPRSFVLRAKGDRVLEMFSPDFYLPELDQYLELTTPPTAPRHQKEPQAAPATRAVSGRQRPPALPQGLPGATGEVRLRAGRADLGRGRGVPRRGRRRADPVEPGRDRRNRPSARRDARPATTPAARRSW